MWRNFVYNSPLFLYLKKVKKIGYNALKLKILLNFTVKAHSKVLGGVVF